MKIASKITVPVWIKNNSLASNLPLISEILEAHNDCLLHITFHKKRNKRSNRQNKYYWAVIIPIMQNCIKEEWNEIHSIAEVHEFLKTNCNFVEIVNEDTGEVLRRTKSTAENTTVDQETFHEKCRRLAFEFFNTEIPLPNEEIELKFD